jgi:hypothetical protein
MCGTVAFEQLKAKDPYCSSSVEVQVGGIFKGAVL